MNKDDVRPLLCVANRLQDVGRAEQILLDVLKDDWIFKDLNRKNPHWDTPDWDKLDDCRRRLDYVHDKICNALELLRNE